MDSDEVSAIFDAQEKWLAEHYPKANVNMGWGIDYIDQYVQTKVYGEGVLTTNVELQHHWESF